MTHDELMARLRSVAHRVPAAFGGAVIAIMLFAYPKALVNLKDTESVIIMLALGAGHVSALLCCIAALKSRGGSHG